MTRDALRRCPVCRGHSAKEGNRHWPLCGERCHLIDLGRWLGEVYRIPGEPAAGDGGGGGDPDDRA